MYYMPKDVMKLTDTGLLRTQAYIEGKWWDADERAVRSVLNPATGEMLGTVPYMGASETRRAIEAAAAAMPAWSARTAKDRAGILRRWYDLMLASQEDLAMLMTAEQGKPLAESRAEIAYAASFIEWFAEEGKRLYGDVIPGHQVDKRILVLRQPVGVVAAITPWNFPAAMIARKAAPALAAGCTFVCKPASQTPYSGRCSPRSAEYRDRGCSRDRRRTHLPPASPQAQLYGLYCAWEEADGGVCRHDEESVTRARRERSLHCV
jgi:succinate-semialdehyde dehydrogenase / glutarate-semialdehyde dehydrogenase